MKHSSPLTRFLRWLLQVVCVLVWVTAFVATHIPVDKLPTGHLSDKTLHFLGYFILCCLLVLVLASRSLPRPKRVCIAIFVMAAYGAIDELTQLLVGRSASVGDWIADVLGAVAAVLFVEGVLLRWPLHNLNTPAE